MTGCKFKVGSGVTMGYICMLDPVLCNTEYCVVTMGYSINMMVFHMTSGSVSAVCNNVLS